MKRHYIIAAGAVAVLLLALEHYHQVPNHKKNNVPVGQNAISHTLVHEKTKPTPIVNGEDVWCAYTVLSADERAKLFKGNGKYLKKVEALELAVRNSSDKRLTIKSDYFSMPFLHSGELSDILNAALKKKMKIALGVATVASAVSKLFGLGLGPAVTAGKMALADRSTETRIDPLIEGYKHPGIFYLPNAYAHQRMTSRGKLVKNRVRGRTYQERLIIEPGNEVKALIFVPRKDLTTSMTVTLKDDMSNKFSLVAHPAVRAA